MNGPRYNPKGRPQHLHRASQRAVDRRRHFNSSLRRGDVHEGSLCDADEEDFRRDQPTPLLSEAYTFRQLTQAEIQQIYTPEVIQHLLDQANANRKNSRFLEFIDLNKVRFLEDIIDGNFEPLVKHESELDLLTRPSKEFRTSPET